MTKIQVRRDTSANWTSVTLAPSEGRTFSIFIDTMSLVTGVATNS